MFRQHIRQPTQRGLAHPQKTRYIEHLNSVDQETLLVSLSDKIHACSIFRDIREPEIGAVVWERFKPSKRDFLVLPRTGEFIPQAHARTTGE